MWCTYLTILIFKNHYKQVDRGSRYAQSAIWLYIISPIISHISFCNITHWQCYNYLIILLLKTL